jgi:hypothetical protein
MVKDEKNVLVKIVREKMKKKIKIMISYKLIKIAFEI